MNSRSTKGDSRVNANDLAPVGRIFFLFLILALVVAAPRAESQSNWDATPLFGPTTPAGLDTWDTDLTTTTENDSVATINLNDIQEPAGFFGGEDTFIIIDTVETLTHSSGDTLDTYWMFETDGDGQSAAGVVETATTNSLGHNNFVTPANFISANIEVDPIDGWFGVTDYIALFVFTSRGLNAEDFGSNSDLTEAPEEGAYTADLAVLSFDQ